MDREPKKNKDDDDDGLLIVAVTVGLITILASWMVIAMIVRSL